MQAYSETVVPASLAAPGGRVTPQPAWQIPVDDPSHSATDSSGVTAAAGGKCWATLLKTLSANREISAQARELLNDVVEHVRAAAIAQERERVAREVHDGIAQTFIGIDMLLSTVPEKSNDVVKSAQRLAQQGLRESRRTIRGLLPGHLAGRPFNQAVRCMASAAVPPPMTLKVESTGDWSHFDPERARELFRMVQEAVNNAVKHSGAKHLSIDLSCNDREAVALVDDDGRGFNVSATADSGFGLISMRQRAACTDARVDIVSSPGQGTQVFISMPLDEEDKSMA